VTPDVWITLSQAGPTAILLVFIAAMVVAFTKGLVVPGWLYQQERTQRAAAERREASLLASLARLTKAAAARRA
jgi:hypothetical protein